MQLIKFTNVPFVNTYAETGRNCTLIVCLNMVEMMYTKFHHIILNLLFKGYVTLPGVARKLLYASTESNFSLINQQNAD